MSPKSVNSAAIGLCLLATTLGFHTSAWTQASQPKASPQRKSFDPASSSLSPGLRRFNIQLPIPDGWKPPAAIIGNNVPKIQDKDRTISPSVVEVYLSPNHPLDQAELEIVLFEASPKYIGAMGANPNGAVPIRGDAIIPYGTAGSPDTVSELINFGNTTAARFRVSRFARSNTPTIEDLYYVSCGGNLVRLQLRSLQPYFETLERTLFSKYRDLIRCPTAR